MSIKIHGHPQKAEYLGASEFPTISCQGHWPKPGQDPATVAAGELAHLHVDMTGPLYAEVRPSDVLNFTFSIALHHVPGRIDLVSGGWPSLSTEGAGILTWDATGTSTPPEMVGDPEGDKTWTGRMELAVDPRMTNWWFASIHAVVKMDNGDTLGVRPQFPVWHTQTMVSQGGLGSIVGEPMPLLNSRVVASDAARPDIKYGDTVAEYEGYIPLAPISTPWFVPTAMYSYGAASALPAAISEARLDLDLHHGIPGTILFHVSTLNPPGNNFGTLGFAFDPTNLTPGPHKWAIMRVQSNPPDQISALVVTTLKVDPNAPPSPIGPVVPPPPIEPPTNPPPVDPPPVDLGVLVTPTFRLFQDGRLRLTVPDGRFVELLVR